MTYLRRAAVVAAGIGLFGLGYTLNDLQNGLVELPRHWWSVAPVILLVFAASAWFAPAARGPRTTGTDGSTPPSA